MFEPLCSCGHVCGENCDLNGGGMAGPWKWKRDLIAKWRALKTSGRRWISAAILAGLGVLGASVHSVLTDQAKGWLTHVVNATEELACEFRKPARAPDQQRPVIILARFEDDTNDEMWHRIIKIFMTRPISMWSRAVYASRPLRMRASMTHECSFSKRWLRT